MNMKQIVFLFVLLLLLSGCDRERPPDGGRGDGEASTTSAAEPTDSTPKATRPPSIGTTVLADGQLVAVKPVLPLGFAVSGRLTDVLVQPGDAVEEGAILATIDVSALSEAITGAELQVAQAENTLAQAQLSLENLENWEADEMVVALAQANLVVAEANYENALTQDSAAGSSLTSARVAIDQAQRGLADVQEAYDTAWDPARDWELGDPWRKQALEYERDGTTRAVQSAQEGLQVAYANYNLASAGLNDNNALGAEANITSAQQALHQAQTGPKESDIAAARLQVEQANLSLELAEFNLEQARNALEDAVLVAPWGGTILSVETAPGAIVGGGSPIMTLLDAENLQFHTTNLSERDLADIEPGQAVKITLKTYSGQEFSGTVLRIVPQSSGGIGDAATFVVVIDLDPADLLLLPGMTGRAEIQRESTS
ncbi:MAG TPA: efflux RND transporter periplasmic adaptor subunit [candidate division Zixibacteria bacterium]|nr:efflux RND transporter periplasmic adaptor subunit [candidate division Zixibacteria bacterium]